VVNDGRGTVEANYILGSGCDFDGQMIVTGALGHGLVRVGWDFSNEPASFARAGQEVTLTQNGLFGPSSVRFHNLISKVLRLVFNRAPGIETVTTGRLRRTAPLRRVPLRLQRGVGNSQSCIRLPVTLESARDSYSRPMVRLFRMGSGSKRHWI